MFFRFSALGAAKDATRRAHGSPRAPYRSHFWDNWLPKWRLECLLEPFLEQLAPEMVPCVSPWAVFRAIDSQNGSKSYPRLPESDYRRVSLGRMARMQSVGGIFAARWSQNGAKSRGLFVRLAFGWSTGPRLARRSPALPARMHWSSDIYGSQLGTNTNRLPLALSISYR